MRQHDVQPSSAARANSEPLTSTESSGKSSNDGHPARVRGPRPHEQVAEERQGPGSGARAADDDRLVAGRVAAGRHDRDARQHLALAVGPALVAPVADEADLGLVVAGDEPGVVAERDLPLGPLGDDRGPRERPRAVGEEQPAGVVEVEVAHRDDVDGLRVEAGRRAAPAAIAGPS